MVTYKTISRSMAFLALAVMVLGQPAYLLAAAPAINAEVIDVALQGQNELHGRVVNAEGEAASGTIVVLADAANRPLVRTTSDEDGRFAFAQVPAGPAVLHAGQSQTHMRTWAAETAPPAAQQEVVLNEAGPTVRGQLGNIDTRRAAILAAWGVALGIGIYYGVKDIGS
jgi:hypothetical protein